MHNQSLGSCTARRGTLSGVMKLSQSMASLPQDCRFPRRAVVHHRPGRSRHHRAVHVLKMQTAATTSPESIAATSARLRSQGRLAEARSELEAALHVHRRSPALQLELAAVLEQQGLKERAVEAYRKAARTGSLPAAAYVNLAALLGSLRRFEEAVPVARRATELASDLPAAHINFGSALAEVRRFEEATSAFERALALIPGVAWLWCELAGCLQFAGRIAEAVAALERALQLDPQLVEARSALLLALNYCSDRPADLLAAHRRWAPQATIRRQKEELAARTRPVVGRGALRVGLVSGDLHRHSVTYFLAPVIDHYDRTRIELTLYATGRIRDEVSAWLERRADAWIDCAGSNDDSLASLLTAARHDLLIDLGGHTSSGRPGVFARRCAPTQLGFLGYPTITGVEAMDARITDPYVDPVDAVAGEGEGPLHLPNSYFCYRPPPGPHVAPLPRLGAGQTTFGCCNSLSKVSDATLALWAQVLSAVPHSRLLLKSQGLKDPGTRQRLLARCRAAGLDPVRLRLHDWQPHIEAHLATYGQIDIALDTYPYNGATTTCEALWMGVPVVSLTGATHASRMGLSILSAAGCGNWAAGDAKGYVAAAAALAADADSLAATRAGLRASVASSALMAETAYVRALEALLLQSAAKRSARG